MSTTIQTLRQESAKLIGALLASGTATGGSQTSLVDTSTARNGIVQSALSNGIERFKGAFLLMVSGTVGNIGQWREISDDAPGSGTITPARGFPSNIQSGDGYEIYSALSPDGWNDAINAGLTRCQYISKSPITLITDGDMEAAGTSSWSGTNATIAKSTSDAVTDGAQSLVVTNTSAGGYANPSADQPCTPGRAFRLWVDYRVVSTGGEHAQIAIKDVTHGTFIQSAISPDQYTGQNTQGGMMSVGFAIPAGCVRFQIQLIGQESTAVVAWDDLVVYDTRQFRYPMPSWITFREQYATLLNRLGTSPLDYTYPDVIWPLNLEEDDSAAVVFRANLPMEAILRPVFLQGEKPYGPISGITDSSTTSCPPEWAKWETAAAAYEFFGQNISQATMLRERADQGECETRVNQLRAIYKPWKNSRVGFKKPWMGRRVVSMP